MTAAYERGSRLQGCRGLWCRETMANLQRYVYWPKMQEKVARFIRGCMFCYTSKPSNMKQGLYYPFLVPTHLGK